MKSGCERLALAWLVAFLAGVAPAVVPSVASLLPTTAHASADLDRRYALETIGYVRAWDNVDGIFADYVGAAYRDYFSRQSRFVLQDLSKGDTVLAGSKLPYKKLIDDPEVLATLARSSRSESLIRTKIQKEGTKYRFTLEWLHAPKMEVLSSDMFMMEGPASGQSLALPELQAALHASLDRLIRKVPMQGQVTGRDGKAVTLNIGALAGLHTGDLVTIATLDEVKKHPLLKEIVDWRLSQTGKLEIDTVEERIAFAHLLEEEPAHPVARYQKIVAIGPPPMPEKKARGTDAYGLPEGRDPENGEDPGIPRLGWVSGGVLPGLFSREVTGTSSGVSIARDGSGLMVGGRVEGQLWFNPNWFAELALTYGFFSYSQKGTDSTSSSGTPAPSATPTAAPTVSGSGSMSQVRAALGYSHLFSGQFFGPKGWLKLGYQSTSYSLPVNSAEYSGPNSFKGLLLGIGGDMPVRGRYGVLLNLDFGLFSGASQKVDGASVSSDSATTVQFFLGGYYRYTQQLTFRAGIDVLSNGADFATTSLSQRTIAFAPSVLYYF